MFRSSRNKNKQAEESQLTKDIGTQTQSSATLVHGFLKGRGHAIDRAIFLFIDFE